MHVKVLQPLLIIPCLHNSVPVCDYLMAPRTGIPLCPEEWKLLTFAFHSAEVFYRRVRSWPPETFPCSGRSWISSGCTRALGTSKLLTSSSCFAGQRDPWWFPWSCCYAVCTDNQREKRVPKDCLPLVLGRERREETSALLTTNNIYPESPVAQFWTVQW